MIHETIKLKRVNKKIKSEAFLKTYVPENSKEFCENRKRKAILVFPGGGYEFVIPFMRPELIENSLRTLHFFFRYFPAFLIELSCCLGRFWQRMERVDSEMF